jgi:photoactive yellow protein
MNNASQLQFDQPDLGRLIDALTEAQLDELAFGVIGFDGDTTVTLYNTFESKYAGLSRERVVGNALFTTVAPCMNNFMVAHRFEETAANGASLDDTIDYVLTLRMRPIKVKLRLLAGPSLKSRYVLVLRP